MFRAALGLSKAQFVLVYVGGFLKQRNLLPLVEALKNHPDVYLILAGYGPEQSALESAICSRQNVCYLGSVQHQEIPKLTAVADAVYYCLSKEDRNSYFSAPNKLFEAMAAGKAILAVKGVGEIGDIVAEEEMGVLVDKPTVDALSTAIDQLRQKLNLTRFQANSSRAYRRRYNWDSAEKRLLQLYRVLTVERGTR